MATLEYMQEINGEPPVTLTRQQLTAEVMRLSEQLEKTQQNMQNMPRNQHCPYKCNWHCIGGSALFITMCIAGYYMSSKK